MTVNPGGVLSKPSLRAVTSLRLFLDTQCPTRHYIRHNARSLSTEATTFNNSPFPPSLLNAPPRTSKRNNDSSHHPPSRVTARPAHSPPPHPERQRPKLHQPKPSSPRYSRDRLPAPPEPHTSPLSLSPLLREALPHLTAQPPFYATIHIHGKPYLVTAGDTVRLPFLMHGVIPGDVLRLDRATVIGSRDWTLRGGSRPSSAAYAAESDLAEPIIGRTEGLVDAAEREATKLEKLEDRDDAMARTTQKGGPRYLDDRLFVCRAVVLGTESEPMRVKLKTKQRQRYVKRVKSKHRYTILKIKEITVRTVAEIVRDEHAGQATST